jgi:cytochrome c-type biogenesis protein CcmE
MKLKYLFAVILVGVAVAVVISTTGSVSQYVDYQTALSMAEAGDKSKVHLVGELTKNSEGQVVGVIYNPTLDPNRLEFTILDEKGKPVKVIANPPTSMQDFMRSEKIVLEGRVGQDGTFVASEILLKCPSKYEETEIKS